MLVTQDDHSNQSKNKVVNPSKFEGSVDFILPHFNHQLQDFPRKMMTAKTKLAIHSHLKGRNLKKM